MRSLENFGVFLLFAAAVGSLVASVTHWGDVESLPYRIECVEHSLVGIAGVTLLAVGRHIYAREGREKR